MGTIFESLEECHGPSPKNPIETTILDGVVGRKISESGIQSVHTTSNGASRTSHQSAFHGTRSSSGTAVSS